MDIKTVKKELKIQNVHLAEMFGFASAVSWRNTTKKKVYESGISKLFSLFQRPFTVFIVQGPETSFHLDEKSANKALKQATRKTDEFVVVRSMNVPMTKEGIVNALNQCANGSV